MRIELPAPAWAALHRAQDDAHTLTLPLGAAAGDSTPADGTPAALPASVHVDPALAEPASLTLTL